MEPASGSVLSRESASDSLSLSLRHTRIPPAAAKCTFFLSHKKKRGGEHCAYITGLAARSKWFTELNKDCVASFVVPMVHLNFYSYKQTHNTANIYQAPA